MNRNEIAYYFDDLMMEESREFIALFFRHINRGIKNLYVKGRISYDK